MALPPQRPGVRGANGAGNADSPVDERHHNEQLADQAQELEESLERLKARYEMWFMGVEKREPNRDRDEIKRAVERIKTAFTRNTGLKFRIQTLAARFISYERMWLRSTREKEEGTYRRDIMRARRRREEQAAKREAAAAAPAQADQPQAGAEPPARPPTPVPGPAPAPVGAEPPARPPPPPPRPETFTPLPSLARPLANAPPPPPAAIGERQMRALYDAYVDAKKRCNEDVSRLTYEALARSVQKQVPELIAKTKARSVEFKVVIQGGKAVLKAVPRS